MRPRIRLAPSVTLLGESFICSLFMIFTFSVSARERPLTNTISNYRSPYSSSSYPITLPKGSREVFVVNFELGFFACQLNASSDFLEVYSLSKLCDGVPDCFSGTDENRDYVPCSGECAPKCAHGVCLKSSTKSECFCDDGYGACDCATPAVSECKYRPCDIFAKCTNTLDSYYCTCLPGYVGDGKSCTDIDECANPQTASSCPANSECCNVPGSFWCRCQAGFRDDGRHNCVDINECVEGKNVCPAGSQCENTPGSYRCGCISGYTFDQRRNQCVDINECVVVGCAAGANCRNYDGGYDCGCGTGDASVDAYDTRASCFAPIPRFTTPNSGNDACLCGPGAICVMRGFQTQCICPPGTLGEPANQRTGCIPSYPVPCNPNVCNGNAVCQGMQCVCAMGFQGTPPNCIDVNECVENPCAANAQCFNLPGSYRCQCPNNLRAKNPFNRQDACIGACEAKQCGRGAICMERQPGNAVCQCPAGFSGIPELECLPVECPQNPEQVCGRNSQCRIDEGSRICTCLPGFRGSPPDVICVEIDECAQHPCAAGAICINTPGSYTCGCPLDKVTRNAYSTRDSCRSCPAGSQLVGPNECGRVNECLNRNPCGVNGQCINGDDGYSCNCKAGYTTINGVCLDIDECTSNPCAAGAICTNTPGSFSCSCQNGFSSKNVNSKSSICVRIVETSGTPCDGFPCWKQGRCTYDQGDDSCYCKDGFDGAPDSACTPEQPLLPYKPPSYQTTSPPITDKSVICLYDRCRCAPGFVGRPPTCSRIDECAENPCSPGQCNVIKPGQVACICPAGYSDQSGRCVSINECAGPKAPCSPGSCIPTPGSYKCVCPKNFNYQDGKCVAINQCLENPNKCSPGNCIAQFGTFRCDCPSGYYFINGACGDVDECVYNPCIPGTCTNLPGTYKCSCPNGYSLSNGQCISIDQCVQNPCGVNGVCIGRPGGYQCACVTGYSFDGTTCVDIDECVDNPQLCQPGRCTNTLGSYVCMCPKGYTFRDGNCIDINECVVARPCGFGMRDCTNTIGSYKCTCRPGYQFNGVTCADINECINSPNLCIPGICQNTEGSYQCVCPAGYEYSRGTCVDVNECSSQPCAKNAVCTNTIGSYECRCPPDMQVGSASDSSDVCLRVDLCLAKQCPPNSECVVDTSVARCVCQDGYIGEPGRCRPGRCQLITCGAHSSCLPAADGGVACLCEAGFRLAVNNQNAAICVDINECADNPNVCGNGRCQNTIGSYSCGCNPGFQFNGVTCEDVDECLGPAACAKPEGSICMNSIGSFQCRCPSGLVQSGDRCSFLRICEQSGNNCGNGQCIDLPNSYGCSCPNGYSYANGTCVAIDQCVLLNPCGPGATCTDLGGRYTCNCPKGFAFDDLTCVDVNECVRNPCGFGARECINTRGSYTCQCQSGYRFNGRSCEDVNECAARPNPCEPGQCINLQGSFSCVCPAGYEVMNGQECVRINQCIYNPCTIGTCIEDLMGGYLCQCPIGFEFTNGMCEDINECAISADLCRPGACVNTIGSFSCRCPKGFQQTQAGCVAIRQCQLPGVCGVGIQGTHCTDLIDGSFECSCPLGYSSTRGSVCVAVNECADNPCSPGTCSSRTPGSYTCKCPQGFASQNGRCNAVGCERAACQPNSRCLTNERSEITCVCARGFRLSTDGQTCVSIDECSETGRNPCGEAGQCIQQEGGYDCRCPKGWQKVGYPPQCADIDECSLYNPCLVGTCLNTKGSYSCSCPAGYQFDNGHCVDVNECANNKEPCRPGTCRNLAGGYACYCPAGYEERNGQCVDVSECATGNPCNPGQCQETAGSYQCICPTGYAFRNGNCTTVNECVPVNPCGLGTCRPTTGSYTCDCLPGYQVSTVGLIASSENGYGRPSQPAKAICVDINECENPDRNPCVLGRCINTDGSYSCVCPKGYFFNGRFCEDRNECVEFLGDLCPGGGTCVNSPGSYRCVCPPRFELIDGRCVDLNTCAYTTCGVQSLPCRDTPNGPLCACPVGYHGDARVACIATKTCEATRDCGPNADCKVLTSESTSDGAPGFIRLTSTSQIVCTCRPGYQGTPPSVPCDLVCPTGMSKDLTSGICSRAQEQSCIQTSCSPGVCQEPGPKGDNSPPCLCPEGTRYLWDLQVCAIIPPVCNSNPCAPGLCAPDGFSYKCDCPLGYRYMDGACVEVNECLENATVCGLGGTCTNKPGSYVCQCAANFVLRDNACWDINKCLAPVNPCDPGRCEHSPGTYRCICPDGFRFMPSIGSCTKVLTPCIQQKDLCSPGQCQAQGENNYRCTCPPGYNFDGVSCVQINQCAQNPCGRGTCQNQGGFYECKCPVGYKNNGRTCLEIDECTLSNPCGVGTCQNLEGSYSCMCPPGYNFDGSSCTDINECTSRNPPNCVDGQCENTVGSFTCVCPPGFRNAAGPGGLALSTGPCVDIKECNDNPNPCSPGQCSETNGGYICQCPNGFQFINGQCVQIDVCVIENKCKPGTCALAGGSFVCTCPAGYRSTTNPPKDCVQINECTLQPPPCGPGALNCIDTLGSYQCVCNRGYKLSEDRKMCVEINECAAPVNPCTPGDCINTPGSLTCICPPGFSNSSGGQCVYVNQCLGPINPCSPGTCSDLIGSYQCNCPKGYTFNKGACVDINECITSEPCRQHGQCVNSEGSYSCRCDTGFEFRDGTCININECKTNPCAQNAQCIDTEGSFTCMCPPPGFVSLNAKVETCVAVRKNTCVDQTCYREGTCRSVSLNRVGGFTEESCECNDNFAKDLLTGTCRSLLVSSCALGYQSVRNGSQVACVNIDECATNPNVCLNGRCVDTIGGYQCICNPDGKTCVEIKQCVERSPCGQGTCVDTAPGKYICKCPDGYSFDGTTCIDVNECINQNPCGVGECINTLGSYVCRCPLGYVFAENRCVDINECTSGPNPCTPGECHNTQGSYFCVCPVGYTRMEPGICVDIDECQQGNPCGDGKGTCINTLGSFQCRCLPGFNYNPTTKTCDRVNECAETKAASLCLPGECQNTLGSHICVCPKGYQATNELAPACVDINECTSNPNPCLPGRCLNTIGSFYCVCPNGYTFTNGICADINECTDKTLCGSGTCRNTLGSYECLCPTGFTFDKVTCVDINECAISVPCGIGSCVNTIGSFLCVCPAGYQPGPNGQCIDIDECTRDPTICGPGTCVNTLGSFVCRCPVGYTLQHGTCFAINECDAPVCGVGTCVDLIGSYQCKCPVGYQFLDGTCIDINECAATPGPCPNNARCLNTPGSYQCVVTLKVETVCQQANPCGQGQCVDQPPDAYQCVCQKGYQFDGRTCVDINECTDTLLCRPGQCFNLPGTYLCVCPFGFNPVNGSCVEVNECLQPVCGTGNCIKTPGSYRCECPPGFQFARGTCVAVDECVSQPCGPGGVCENLPGGTYTCKCSAGFTFNGKTCIKVDQCAVNPCGTGVCENSFNTYRCICPTGFQFANGTCVDVNECLLGNICGSGQCVNTIGSYQCNCLRGYRFVLNSCYDINECAENVTLCGLGTCQNLPGTYKCFCPPGFKEADGTCVDINECVEQSPCNLAVCVNTLGSYRCVCTDSTFILDTTRLICIPICTEGFIRVNDLCVPRPSTTTPRSTTPRELCRDVICVGGFAQANQDGGCDCITPPPTTPVPTNPPTVVVVTTPPVPVPRTEVSIPEAAINCQTNGIDVQISWGSSSEGLIFVKNYSRDDNCRKEITGNVYREFVHLSITYGNCGVNPDGNLAEFILVVQRHPTLITIDATAFNIRCVYKEQPPVTVTASTGLTVRIITQHYTIANQAPPPECRIIIMNSDGTAVSNANIGQNLQLKVSVSPYGIYGGFASSCMAIAVDNSWKFQVTDVHGCATDRTIFTEWVLDPTDHTLRANFSAFKFPGASLLRFQCNIRICFKRCPPVICQPGSVQSYGRKKRQLSGPNIEDVAPKGDVIEEIQVQSSGLQTFDVQASALNGTNGVAAATGSGDDQVCLSATSFGVTLAITLLLALVAIAISVSCWLMAYRRRPESDEVSYPRSSGTGYGNGTQYSQRTPIPRVTVPSREPDPDY
ncbi:Fibrillin-1 [Hypsibius exemplaris]|uniref:Fibrillin-1 n=1 Tax=Hypsibius exemplaris TaxID=2072580 RepID=A0A1W0XCK6_HYPEX|nr:Fibrillin-1 [Hypsibius exemplaris]